MRLILMSLVCATGCGLLPQQDNRGAGGSDVAVTAGVVRPEPRPATLGEISSETSDEEAATAPARTGALGTTVASLGNAAEPGLWLKTPLVSTEQPGRVRSVETGQSVAVTLIPIEGPETAGSRLSLSAMQAIGAPLTGLPEVQVTAEG